MGEISLLGYICDRCNHKWVPRTNSTHKPIVCSACKSPYWNIPRKISSQDKVKKRNKKEHFDLFPTKIKNRGIIENE